MKRKLDDNDHPTPALDTSEQVPKTSIDKEVTFQDFGLDPRLLQATAKLNFQRPSLVQQKVIPLIREGKDVVARANTGSGKTLSFLLPILDSILRRKQASATFYTAALILVPTRELADQITKHAENFSAFCAKDIQAVNLTRLTDSVTKAVLASAPDIVVSTPGKLSDLNLEKLTHIVIDECDIVFSYGYGEDLQSIARSLPKGVQTILTSATLTAEVDTLKEIFCRNSTSIDLEETDAEGEGVSQYVVKCAEDEKFLLTYVIFKLSLIKGKVIIFVSDVDRCYRLKLFFEQFGIRSCILNPELPVNSRIHVVEEFNRNVYDIIIASDENEILGDEYASKESDEIRPTSQEGDRDAEDEAAANEKAHEKEAKRPKKKRRTSRRDKEYGVSRGIDFKAVACVINFDLPTSSKSYTHRIGRTARAGQTGMALSFVVPKEHYRKHMPTTVETTENDEKVLARIEKQQAKRGKEVKPYTFDMKQVEAFRYRMNDALRAVTKVAVREARTRELRQELLKSEKLKRHFEENPAELHHLRHDGELRAARTQAHLKHVPEYLLPAEGKKALTKEDIGFVPFRKAKDSKGRRGKSFKKKGGRRIDPLKSFKARSKKK